MKTVDELKRIFEVKEDQELADILGRTPGAVSNWRKGGLPASIERRALEIMKDRGISEVQPLTIAEQLGPGYAPEVKLMADYLEVKIKGKTAEERLQIVEEIMEQIRNKYK